MPLGWKRSIVERGRKEDSFMYHVRGRQEEFVIAGRERKVLSRHAVEGKEGHLWKSRKFCPGKTPSLQLASTSTWLASRLVSAAPPMLGGWVRSPSG